MSNPYLYPNTNVLRNKLNLMDNNILARAERAIVIKKVIDMASMYDKIDLKKQELNYNDFCNIHKFLFEDIYEWAGEPRIVNMRKSEQMLNGESVRYAPYKQIPDNVKFELMCLDHMNWKDKNIDEKVNAFSKSIANIWKIHPFRDGNTRTTSEFMILYARKIGLDMNRETLSRYAQSRVLRNAFVLASVPQKKFSDDLINDDRFMLNKIIKTSLFPTQPEKEKKQSKKSILKQLETYKKETKKPYDIKNKETER